MDSPNEDTQVRSDIREALQRAAHDPRAEDAQSGVVTAWVTVIEVMQTDGSKYLLRLAGDAADSNLTTWARDGFFHAGLDKSWNDEE